MPTPLRRRQAGLSVRIHPAPSVSLVSLFLDRRSESTRRAYSADLADFAAFLGVPDQRSALGVMVQLKAGQANSLALRYRQTLIAAGKSPNTVNRRLATLRSATKLARTIGAITWSLEIENEPAHSYRDTSGPGLYAIRRMLKAAAAQPHAAKAARDTAILRLLFDLALRRKELVGLNLANLDLDNRRLSVIGKSACEKQVRSLPAQAAAAVSAWLEFRGTDAGPLFTNFDRAGKGYRLTGAAIFYIIRRLGLFAGVITRPHGLRHTAITQTRAVYDNHRRDYAGAVAELIAESAR